MYDNYYYLTKGAKQFLITLIKHKTCCSVTNIGLQQNIWSLHIQPSCYKILFYFFSPSIRMSGKNVNFDD